VTRVPWQQYTEHQRMAVLLGTIPHGLQVKFHKAWIATILTPARCLLAETDTTARDNCAVAWRDRGESPSGT
jgi:desulfoferrodoxin (superoxide reductase-like protein)